MKWQDVPQYGELINRLWETSWDLLAQIGEILDGGDIDDEEIGDIFDEYLAVSERLERELYRVNIASARQNVRLFN